MTLLNNNFWRKLEQVYGEEWRTKAPEDTGYSYAQLWRMATGAAKVPLILKKYLDNKLARKRPNAGKKGKK